MLKNNSDQLISVFSEFIRDTMNGIIVFDGNDRIIFCNQSAANMYELSNCDYLLGKTFDQMVKYCYESKTGMVIETNDLNAWLEYAHAKRRSKEYRRFEIDLHNGSWYLVSEQLVENDCIVMICTDITDKKNAENRLNAMSKELFFLATTDSLTNTFNRRYFIEQAQVEKKRCQREKYGYALLMLDLDSFKAINDNYGHACGDAVLTAIADTIRLELRDYDLLGRMGGEEFSILLPNTTHASALSIAQRIRHSIENRTIEYQDHQITVTASIGVSLDQNADQDFENLFLAADNFLYQAKENGRNQVVTDH